MSRLCMIITWLFLSNAPNLMSQSVTIVKDPRLDMLLKKQSELNKEVDKINNKTGPGFRVMVVNTNNRSVAIEVKSKMLAEFPEHKSYLVYQSPYFKIIIGNFRNRQDADNLRTRIARFYPTGVMVVPAIVEYKPEKEEEYVEE